MTIIHGGRVHNPDFVLDAAARERLVDRFGPGTQRWCDDLPGLVARCCSRWDLELDEALSGGTSRVFLGRRRGGRGVVLKLTPDRSVAETEAAALRAWAANPQAVDLLDADAETGALLLEKLEPGTRLSDHPRFPSFAEIAALLTGLRAADQDRTGPLPTLAQRVDFLFGLIGRRLNHPGVAALVTPGMAGDRTYDGVDWALSRATTAAGLAQRIQQLCVFIPGLDGDRLHGWCQATAVIIAVQHLYRRPPDDTTQLALQLAAAV